jgi:LysM repeat protein
VLLAAFALVLSLLLGAPISTPAPTPTVPALPPTQPGLSHNEGWFLATSADDGSQAIYFIAGNARHSITQSDAQLELQVNPLWPIRQATQDEVVAIPEGAPVGGAKPGLVGAPAPDPVEPAAPQPDAEPAADSAPAPDAAPATDATPASDAAPVTYVLQRGDNLTRIAAQYGTTVDAILAANGISNPNRIYAGLPLIIPIAGSDTAVADDTAAPTDVQADTSVADSADAADTTDEAQAASTYTVAPGDSAFKIARRFGIDEGALLEANNISNPNRVYVGQVLTIPGA